MTDVSGVREGIAMSTATRTDDGSLCAGCVVVDDAGIGETGVEGTLERKALRSLVRICVGSEFERSVSALAGACSSSFSGCVVAYAAANGFKDSENANLEQGSNHHDTVPLLVVIPLYLARGQRW
jgi:hypothetical protein